MNPAGNHDSSTNESHTKACHFSLSSCRTTRRPISPIFRQTMWKWLQETVPNYSNRPGMLVYKNNYKISSGQSSLTSFITCSSIYFLLSVTMGGNYESFQRRTVKKLISRNRLVGHKTFYPAEEGTVKEHRDIFM